MVQAGIAEGREPWFRAPSEIDRGGLRAAILRWAGEIMTWDLGWDSGIYPGEMAAFLGLCDACAVRSVVESGRGEGYSTQILGEYAARTGARVVSIDLETDPEQARRCRERLSRFAQLRCIVGDAFDVLPEAVDGLPGPIAILLDGPKLHAANRLSLVASVMFPVGVVAHHNCELVTPWGKEFAEVFPSAFHYESLGMAGIPEWDTLKRWEREWVRGYELPSIPGRSLAFSSLAMAVVSPEQRSKKRLVRLGAGAPRYNPMWLRLKWSWTARSGG